MHEPSDGYAAVHAHVALHLAELVRLPDAGGARHAERQCPPVSVERANPPELGPPSGFSHAVIGRGTVVFLAGQTAIDASGQITAAGIVAQFEQALGRLLAALRACGGTPDQLASLTVYVTDLEDYRAHGREIGAVWRQLAGRDYPAMAAVGVCRLWDTAALVEVQGFAVI